MMKLNEAQLHLVSSLHTGRIPQLNEFIDLLDEETPTERYAELGHYMKELEKEGYIKTSKNTYREGGQENKYGNRVRLIWFDEVKLTSKAIRGLQNDEL